MTLTADVMFVNGVEFLNALSRKIRLITTEHIPSRKSNQLRSLLKKIVELNSRGGFMVNVSIMDQEFDKVESNP